MKLVTTHLKIFLLTAFCLSLVSEGRGPSKRHSTFYDFLTSSDFECKVESKRVFKPGTLNENYDPSGVTPICTMAISCRPVAGITAKTIVAAESCYAPEGVCEEPIDCAKRKVTAKDGTGRTLNVASLAESANNKFGDVCWETNGNKVKRGTVSLFGQGKVVEEYCSTVYVCRSRTTPAHASCPIRKESNQDVCPQLNDCINNDLTFPGYTESELRLMTSAEREKVRKDYEAGKKVRLAAGEFGVRTTFTNSSVHTVNEATSHPVAVAETPANSVAGNNVAAKK